MATPGDLITRALRKSGVLGEGQTAAQEDIQDALADLNGMLAQWQRKRWLVYHLVDASVPCTGQISYTMGPGGDIPLTRPDRLESAFLRQTNTQPNPIDYPLELLESREDYNRLALKSLATFSEYIFYDAAYPLGIVYPWPVPSAIYELHVTVKETISAPLILGQTINLPPEYAEALMWNLAARMRPSYQMAPDPTVTGLAVDSLNLIRNANAQIPRLSMPPGMSSRGSAYNVYSDRGG